MKLLILLGLGPSLADEIETMRQPTQCDVVFIAPKGENCKIEGSWATTASARTGPKAKELALERLKVVVQLEMQIRLNEATPTTQDLIRPLLIGCSSEAMTRAEVYCSEEPELSEKQYCYASFNDTSCWKGVGVEVTGKPTWKAMEQGRASVCESMDTWMLEHNMNDLKRDHCMMSCLQSAKVACRTF